MNTSQEQHYYIVEEPNNNNKYLNKTYLWIFVQCAPPTSTKTYSITFSLLVKLAVRSIIVKTKMTLDGEKIRFHHI